jgi:hypothetical protein
MSFPTMNMFAHSQSSVYEFIPPGFWHILGGVLFMLLADNVRKE